VAHVADVEIEPERRRPRVSAIISGGALRCLFLSGPAHTADTGIMCARFRVCTIGWRTLA
jgi:hypothetical protein